MPSGRTNLDFAIEVSRGNLPLFSALHKFGHAPTGVQTSATDIWDRADATPTQQIWTAPTTARVHAIASTSDADGKTGSPSSAGARTLRVWGLTGWGTAEVSEDITLTGTDAVNTSNSYVIIHRMRVLTHGATNVNVGVISATAATDSTVTAAIRAGQGQTQMAIYGIPSVRDFYMTAMWSSFNKAASAGSADITLHINETPDSELTNFITKHRFAVQSTGSSDIQHRFDPPLQVSGPAIIKIQGLGSAADLDISAGFDGYVVG